MNVKPIDEPSREFAQSLWDRITDGGVWAVPRTGLLYTKDEATNQMRLMMRMPWFPGLSVNANELAYHQDIDHQGVREMFFTIGVEVTDEAEA